MVCLMLLPPPVFTLEILWNSLTIFTGHKVLHWNGSSKSTFMTSFSSVQRQYISHNFLEGSFISSTILYFPMLFQNYSFLYPLDILIEFYRNGLRQAVHIVCHIIWKSGIIFTKLGCYFKILNIGYILRHYWSLNPCYILSWTSALSCL